jgi:hypothetical protein
LKAEKERKVLGDQVTYFVITSSLVFSSSAGVDVADAAADDPNVLDEVSGLHVDALDTLGCSGS